jgi:hypothetical protein
LKLLSSQSRIQVLKAILAEIRPESAREALLPPKRYAAAARVCGKSTAWWALTLDGRQQHMNASSATIAHKAHSGASPIIGQ